MITRLKKYWFILGLTAVFSLVIADTTGTMTSMGKWFKDHHGTDVVMFAIFLASGLMLDTRRLKSGAGDLKGLCTALLLIFVIAPVFALFLGKMPIHQGIIIGFFIVSAAPTTLSSGVVMTAASGGSMAHALLITLLSNSLAVITVPLTLPFLLGGGSTPIGIDQGAIIFKIGTLVLCPLFIGLLLRVVLKLQPNQPAAPLQLINQLLILLMVSVGLSQARDALFSGGSQIALIVFLVVLFHGLMLLSANALARYLRLPLPIRKSVIFMGSQKTLPLTLMLQVSAFPAFPLALVVCVLHHITQLFMDGYLVGKLTDSLKE